MMSQAPRPLCACAVTLLAELSKMNVGRKGGFVVVTSLLAVVLLLAYIGKRDCGIDAVVSRGVRTAKVAHDAGNAQAGRVAYKLQSCRI